MNITNDKVLEFIESYYAPLTSGLAELRNTCDSNNVPLILKETENFLTSYLSVLKPRHILEVGTAYGYSSIYFATLLPEATVTTIEKDEIAYNTAVSNVRDFGFSERIKVIHGDANEALEEMATDPEHAEYDFVFLDAAKSHYKEFLNRAERICTANAIVICDNILMNAILVDPAYDRRRRHRTSVKRMHEFLEYIYDREDMKVTLLSCGDGLAIINLNER